MSAAIAIALLVTALVGFATRDIVLTLVVGLLMVMVGAVLTGRRG